MLGVKKEFIGFVELEKMDAESAVIDYLKECNLD